MPPKRRPVNVVRSGNAGNSSKAKPKEETTVGAGGGPNGASGPAPVRSPPLFPVGYKSPVTILNEKCQKLGWERAVIDTKANARSNPTTYSGSVTLRKRVSKNIYDLDEVRMSPHPPLEIEESSMAKHYLATYALFRFCSHLPLALTLPPVIRPYWSTLMAEKSAAPAHRAWEWNPDPFAAKKEVEERQSKRKDKEEKEAKLAKGEIDVDGNAVSGGGGGGGGGLRAGDGSRGGKQWEEAPEVRMAPTLREAVEGTVRRLMQRFPSAVLEATRDATATKSTMPSGTNTPTFDSSSISSQLSTLGFRPAHIRSCMAAVEAAHSRLHSSSSSTTTGDPLVLALSTLSPLEASIEWLLLHVPEDDLPMRYRPSSTSADFITSASNKVGGKEALVRGWVVDKLVKQAGFPRRVVESVLNDEDGILRKGEVKIEIGESTALDILGRKLCGWTDEWGPQGYISFSGEAEERDNRRDEEIMTLEAIYDTRFKRESVTDLAIEIPAQKETKDSLSLHIIFDDQSPYPSPQHPTSPPAFYITSPTLPSYIRLHLHASLLAQFRDESRHDLTSILESGSGGAILSMIEYLETILPDTIANPPDVGMVTRYLVPKVPDDILPPTNRKQPASMKRKARNGEGGRLRKPTVEEHEAVRRKTEQVFARKEYSEMLEVRKKLPAWKERHNICNALESNRVLVVVGETGCGKSTQLPQFLLDHEIASGRGASTNIIVTQPRRVAAMGVASRVAQERLEDIDKSNGTEGTVGYAIRGERRSGPNTKLLFCTTGVVLRRLGTGDRDLEGVSHVVVDEAHERGVDTDLLICLLRDLLERNKTIKVVLMSATINEQIFINYFGGCPSLTIPGFTYPVTDHYLEDVISHLNYQPQTNRFAPRLTEEQKTAMRTEYSKLNLDHDSLRALEIISSSDRTDYGLVAAIAKFIVNTSDKEDNDGAILIFMSGVMEIRQCITELERAHLGNVEILPLHANLSSAEQRRVFVPTKPRRKIVVATNVAETSVTIPDVVYVIDSGRVKETQYDAESGLQRLVEVWTSRASGRQRRGRAGRTQPGQCYKLYTRRTENNSMARFPVPEILRTPLESLFLQVKAMDEETDVKAFLGKAIDSPKMDAMDAAWKTLVDLGAVEGEEQSSKLTALGKHMSMIPVDIRLSKMLVLGTIFKCLDPILTIAALLSSKPLFASPLEKRDESKKAREGFATARSDLLTDVKAYDSVIALRSSGQSAVRQYCEKNFISPSSIRDITSLRQDFISALSQIGFISNSTTSLLKFSVNSGVDNLVKAVVVGGLYPRVARIALPQAQYERIQQGSIQKDHEAKEVKFFDQSGRVFLHPNSILFNENGLKPGYVAYFAKAETSKVFLRDATEVPLYGLLLFGGQITINHWVGGIMLGKDGHVKLRAGTRIGVLCSQLRRLLDAQMAEQIEAAEVGDMQGQGQDEVTAAMMALLARDGLSV